MSLEDAIKSMWEIDSEDLKMYEEYLEITIKEKIEKWIDCEKEERHLKAIKDYRLFYPESKD